MARGRKPTCPYCGSAETRAKGYRKTVTLGLRKRRLCKSCKRMFTAGAASAPGNPGKAISPDKMRKSGKKAKKTPRSKKTRHG